MRSDEHLKALTEAFRKAETEQQKKNIKQGAVAFLPAANVAGGRAARFVSRLTGLAMCDVDHIPADQMARLTALAAADPHTLLCYVTLSGLGLRIIYAYEYDSTQPIESQKKFYKRAFLCGNAYYARLLGVDYDHACQDVVRLSVCAHCPDIVYHPDATPFTQADIAASAGMSRQEKAAICRVDKVFKKLCEPRLRQAGVEFADGSHNNYVMRTGYMMNDFGLPLDDVALWASQRFGRRYEQAEQVVRSCYAAQPDEFGKGADAVKRLYNEGGADNQTRNASVEEIEAFLNGIIVTRRNVLKDRLEFRAKDEDDTKFRYITEADVKTLWVRMSHERKVNLHDIYNVLESDFSTPYNPLHSYLNSLPTWTPDQPDYIAELARTVRVEGDEREQERFAKYLKTTSCRPS
jgi:hypothetical protein